MTRMRMSFRIDTGELRGWSDEMVGSLVKATMLVAERHPMEVGILSWHAKDYVSLLFVPRNGNGRPNPRYEIHIEGGIINSIEIVSPQDDPARERLV